MSVGSDHEPDAIGQFSDCSWQELRGPDLGCQPGAQAKGCLRCTSPLVGLSSKAEFPVTSVFSLKTGAFQVAPLNLTLVQCNKDPPTLPCSWLL